MIAKRALTPLIVGVTILLWLLAQPHLEHPKDFWPWIAPSQITALVATALMSLALLAGARSKSLEWLFGGLDKAVRFHRKIALSALILVAIHLLLLIPVWIGRGISLADLFVPFYSEQTRSLDILLTYGFIVLAILAYSKSLKYEIWQWIHRINGLLFAIFSVRILFVPGTITEFEPLRTWMVFLSIIGVGAYLYRVFLFRRFADHYSYRLEEIKERQGDAFDLILRPIKRRMMYEPGTFAWISVPQNDLVATQLHPFSISSSPVQRDLRFSIRKVGDYTKALSKLPINSLVNVYGPFGSFSPHTFADFRRIVLIGSGIGITPFLSMLRFEQTNNDFRRIWLYYVVRNRKDAGYDDEISSQYEQADSYIDYCLWVTKEQGRITAAEIVSQIAPIDDFAVMLCGSRNFAEDISAQFAALGIPANRIISEDFSFR